MTEIIMNFSSTYEAPLRRLSLYLILNNVNNDNIFSQTYTHTNTLRHTHRHTH